MPWSILPLLSSALLCGLVVVAVAEGYRSAPATTNNNNNVGRGIPSAGFVRPARSPLRTLASRSSRQSPLLLSSSGTNEAEWSSSYDDDDREEFGSSSFPSSSSSSSSFSSSKGSGGWSVADNWNRLSRENPGNTVPRSSELYNQDILKKMAGRLEEDAETAGAAVAAADKEDGDDDGEDDGVDDRWLMSALDEIMLKGDQQTASTAAVDEEEDKIVSIRSGKPTIRSTNLRAGHFVDEMGKEIAMLVRCNQRPEQLLIREGRALPPLTEDEKNDAKQLVSFQEGGRDDDDDDEGGWIATDFLQRAVETMFDEHAVRVMSIEKMVEAGGNGDIVDAEIRVLDGRAAASWMRKCLGGAAKAGNIGPHDGRVREIVSRYGAYGTGYLTLRDFQTLYLDAVTGCSSEGARDKRSGKKSGMSTRQLQRRRREQILSVWRDIRNHGIKSPAETERIEALEAMGGDGVNLNLGEQGAETIMDECEILYDDDYNNNVGYWDQDVDTGEWKRTGKSSHERVELAYDKQTPLYMRDGDFVFIDEESCIGCTQCATVSPSSFHMLDDGRARTFRQRAAPDVAAAVSSCPVNCMHRVGYDQLRELETARDSVEGDGRTDHRHFGKRSDGTGGVTWIARTPLHVSGMESDQNHKSSWYHYLVNKCFVSGQCPQRGCYDCPRYKSSPPGSNPHCREKMKHADHVRAVHFSNTGVADRHRKVADL